MSQAAEQRARELYEADRARRERVAMQDVGQRRRDRNGVPVPHEFQPWERVHEPFRSLWMRKAREVLEQEEK